MILMLPSFDWRQLWMLELVKVRIQSVHLGSRVRVCTHKSADGQSSCLSLIRFLTQQFKNSPPTPVTVWNTFYISVPKERVLSSGWEGEEHGRVLVDVQRAQQWSCSQPLKAMAKQAARAATAPDLRKGCASLLSQGARHEHLKSILSIRGQASSHWERNAQMMPVDWSTQGF